MLYKSGPKIDPCGTPKSKLLKELQKVPIPKSMSF